MKHGEKITDYPSYESGDIDKGGDVSSKAKNKKNPDYVQEK
jgi:hypothetical protein